MRKPIMATLAMLAAATTAQAGSTHFISESLSGVKLKHTGRIAIRNDSRAITAYQLSGEIQRALFSLKSLPVFGRSYGAVTRNGQATMANGLVPVYLHELISAAGKEHGVDPRLVAAVVRRESAFNATATSSVGAQGLMQLMPSTARWLGVSDSYDPRQNVSGGARYLRMLLDTFNGDLNLTLAAYNAGPGAVQKYRGVPPFQETQAYVAAVRASYEKSLNGR